MKASNFKLHVLGNDDKQLHAAITLAMDDQKFCAWKEHDGWLMLYWSGVAPDAAPLPFDGAADVAEFFVQAWLESRGETPEPDIDGHCEWEGFEILSGYGLCSYSSTLSPAWSPYEILRIKPCWAEYHK